MHRILTPIAPQPAAVLRIDDAQAIHHLGRVLRAQPGEAIECLDGKGLRLQGVIRAIGKQFIEIEEGKRTIEPQPQLQITLAQALIKAEHFEWALQKATELGAVRIIPLITQRTQARDAEGFSETKLSRWQRIIEAAALQCGCAWLPVLEKPRSYEELIEAKEAGANIVLAAAENPKSVSMKEALKQLQQSKWVTVFIGPEGDFSPQEIEAAIKSQATLVWLGSRILRSETAAVAALSLLQFA